MARASIRKKQRESRQREARRLDVLRPFEERAEPEQLVIQVVPVWRDLDMPVLKAAVEQSYWALPESTRERLMLLADQQGGFPIDWKRTARSVEVWWADVLVASVPYALIAPRPRAQA